MFGKLKKKSVITSWIYFFVGLMVFITLIFAFFSYSSQKKMKDISYKSAQCAFNAALDSVQYKLSAVTNQYLSLSESDNLLAVTEKDVTDWFKDEDVQKLLDEVVAGNKVDQATSFYVYFRNKGIVITENGIFSDERFFKDRFSTKLGFEQWAALHNGEEIVENEVIWRGTKKVPCVMLCMPVYKSRISLETKEYGVVIGYVIEKERFFAQNNNMEWISDAQIYLIDENGKILFRTRNGAPTNITDIKSVLKDSKDAVWSSEYFYHSTKKMSLYFKVPPEKLYPEGKIWYVYIFLCLGVLLIGIVSSIKIFVEIHYGRIDDLMKMLPEQKDGNEWEILGGNLKKILEENKSFQVSRNEMEEKFRQTVLRQALYIADDAENVREYFHENKIELDADLITVTLFSVPSVASKDDTKALLKELCTIIDTDNAVSLKNGMIAVISGVGDENGEMIEKKMKKAAAEISEKNSISIECFCSEACFISDIPKAYMQALKKTDEGEEKRDFSKNESSSTLFCTMEDKVKIFENLFVGKYEKVEEVLNKIFKKLEEEKYSARAVSIFASDMVSLILDVVQRKNIELFRQEEMFDFNKTYIFGNDIEQMHKKLLEIVKKISLEIEGSGKSSQRQLCENMYEYIAENYRDVNISLKTLAERFSISPSYVSMNFSKLYGASPMYFVNKYRLEEAAKLLLNPTLSVEKIAHMVGYSHERTFSRNFKKMKGIYPNEYRKLQ